MFNIINGGRHAANSTDFQEFMVVPIGFDSFSRALRAGVEIYHALEDILRARRASTNLGDEGGFAPPLESNQAALELVMEGIERAGYVPGDQCYIAMDVAASEFMLEDGRYSLIREGAILTPKQLIERYERWISEYPIISIEDGLAEEDWDNWGDMTNRIGSRIQLVGDDIYSTNTTLIKKGIDLNVSNTVLIKFNQIGTVSETFDAIHACSKVGWNTIISHRSGETIDDTIADLAVGTSAGQIKAGAPARGERICKYNRLLRIEEELGDKASFAGRNIYERFLSHR
jgi:enolase